MDSNLTLPNAGPYVSPRLLALIPAAVAINLAIGRLVNEIGLPVYLDAVGTIIATVLAGLGPGIAVGLMSQLLSGLISGYQWLAFAPVQLLIAVLAYVAATHGGFRTIGASLGWGLLTGLAGGLVSALISYILFRGVTATGVTAVTTLLRGIGMPLQQAVLGASLSTDLLDKGISFVLVGLLLRALPRRLRARFPGVVRAVGARPSP